MIVIRNQDGDQLARPFPTVLKALAAAKHRLMISPANQYDSITVFVDNVDVISVSLKVETFEHTHLHEILDDLIEQGRYK